VPFKNENPINSEAGKMPGYKEFKESYEIKYAIE
jgi:hypothetical protein